MEGLNIRSIEFLAVACMVALLGSSSVIWAAIADENESYVYILEPEAREDLIAFVNEASDFVVVQGKDKALEVFNDPNGEFTRGELYIIAYDFNGTRLAHPYLPAGIGKNALNVTDSNGVADVVNMREVAKRGEGWTYYIWPNPAHSDEEQLKLTYVLKVDDGLWLAAGTYLRIHTPIFSNEYREDLVGFVGKARDFALSTSQEEAVKAFNDINGSYVEGNRYIFAYDFAGNCLALPTQSEFLGVNRINITDSNGVEYIRDMIALAKGGNGFVYYIKPDPAENMTQGFKLSYITKVDDTWWLGAGIYA
ncbi:MAG: Cache domain protein [Methanosaeta sp. PtaU1.Bin112]|nr:MAG: Cache domain protein [Methanosaeta sp. PtaU1.Bin112]